MTPVAVLAPFAWEIDSSGALVAPVGKLVTRCALSRICGVCHESLGRPIAFVGSPGEVGRNAFHAPPMHTVCAEHLRMLSGADPTWQVVTTAGFEFVRPSREDDDRRPRFEPNSLL